MAVDARTRCGLLKYRAAAAGGRIALVAPASPLPREEFDKGAVELARLGFEAVFDDSVFDRHGFVAGTARGRAAAFARAWARDDVDAVMAVRGGYGSLEILPFLDDDALRRRRPAFVGYSDVTSIHVRLNCHVGLASLHGAMIDRRISCGPAGYDAPSLTRALSATPLGELTADTMIAVREGDVRGPLFGGTLTQLVGSLGTPYAFDPPPGHVLFVDEIGERPYRLQRMLTQLRQSGRLAGAVAVVFGQLPQCDEPSSDITARGVLTEVFADFPGPVIVGFPSGHTTTPLLSVPFGVEVRVVAGARSYLVFEEAAAA